MNLIQNFLQFPVERVKNAPLLQNLLVVCSNSFSKLNILLARTRKILINFRNHTFLWDPFQSDSSLNSLAKHLLFYIFSQGVDFKMQDTNSFIHHFSKAIIVTPDNQIIIPHFLSSTYFIMSQLAVFDYAHLEDALLDIGSRTINKLFNETNGTNQIILRTALYETIYYLIVKKKVIVTDDGFILLVKKKFGKIADGVLKYDVEEASLEYYNFCKKLIFFEMPLYYSKFMLYDRPLYILKKLIKAKIVDPLEIQVEKMLRLMKTIILLEKLTRICKRVQDKITCKTINLKNKIS